MVRKVHAIGIKVPVGWSRSFQPLEVINAPPREALQWKRFIDLLNVCVALRPVAAWGWLLKLSPPSLNLSSELVLILVKHYQI